MLHKMGNFLIKLKNWVVVMVTTSTVEGPPFFFQRAYFLLNTATLIEMIHRTTGRKVRSYLQRKLAREVVIHNKIGTFAVNAKNDSFTKALASFEHAHQPWLAAAVSRGIFIDIGANIGFYSILACKTYGYTHAHAFEPNPDTHRRLQRNVELNSLTDSVYLYSVGLSDTKRTRMLNAKSVHTGGSTFVERNASNNLFESIEVPVDTFDNICNEQNLRPGEISFIKIDVEGFEYNVLKGMHNTLQNLKQGTCLFIEIHPTAQYAPETKALIADYGFELLTSSPQKNFLYRKT